MSAVATVLIVEDEPLVARGVMRMLPPGIGGQLAGSVAQAIDVLRSGTRMDGLAIDVYLPDGSGLDVLETSIERRPTTPVLVMTAHSDNRVIANRACSKNARFLAKPFGAADIQPFALDVFAAHWAIPRTVVERFMAFSGTHRLSPRQIEFFAKHVAHVPRTIVAEQLGISMNTLKTRTRQLCRKLGVDGLDVAYERMLREAV
jgi:DNA-binding NarL/FixJ family response regulator